MAEITSLDRERVYRQENESICYAVRAEGRRYLAKTGDEDSSAVRKNLLTVIPVSNRN